MKVSNLVSPELLKQYLGGMPESDVNKIECSFNDRFNACFATFKEHGTNVDSLFIEHVEDQLYSWHWCDVCATHYSYDEPCTFH